MIELTGIKELNTQEQITLLEIHSSELILTQFKNLKISNMILKFMQQFIEKDIENLLDMNSQKNLKNFELYNLDLQSTDIATNIKLHSYDTLIINEVQIKDLETKYRYTFENIKMIIINNLNLTNLNIQSEYDFFSFKSIEKIIISNIILNDSQFEKSFISFSNVISIKMINITIDSSQFKKDIISVEQVQNFNLENISIKSSNLKNTINSFAYALQFMFVENATIYNSTLSDIHSLGFISFEGTMSRLKKLSSLSIEQCGFTNIKISQPFIILKFTKQFNLTMLNAKNIEFLEIANFIDLFSIPQVDLKDFNMSQFNLNIKQNRILELQSLSNNQISFLLSFQGISNSTLQNIFFNQCNQIGILSLTPSDEKDGIIEVSKFAQITNLKLENSQTNILNLPLFRFQIKQAEIFQLIVFDIQTQHHIIETNSFQLFTIYQSQFTNIVFKNSSTTFIAQNSGTLILNQTKFDNIISYNSSSSLIINEIETLIIDSSNFTNLKNKQQIDDILSKRIYYDGNINIQKCSLQLKVINSLFQDNESFLNGGVFNLNRVQDITIITSNFTNNSAQTQSGGAIYVEQSNMNIKSSQFKENKSLQEKGGAICSINQSPINLQKTNITNNYAVIGGGIYHDITSNLDIDETNILSGNNCNQFLIICFINIFKNQNIGSFYGKNKGSHPTSIKGYDILANKSYEQIDISYFQSGNYTKQDIYVSYFDEEDNILNFNGVQKTKVSEMIQLETKIYSIELKNINESQLYISYGQQLKQDQVFKNVFKLNITASFSNQKHFELQLISNLQNIQIKPLKLQLNFRDCIFGEITTYRSGFIEQILSIYFFELIIV